MQEERDVLIVFHQVQYPYDCQFVWGYGDPSLFPRFANHGGLELLSAVDVTGDHAVIPVLVPGVVAAEHEDFAVLHEKEMDRYGNQEHHYARCILVPSTFMRIL